MNYNKKIMKYFLRNISDKWLERIFLVLPCRLPETERTDGLKTFQKHPLNKRIEISGWQSFQSWPDLEVHAIKVSLFQASKQPASNLRAETNKNGREMPFLYINVFLLLCME